MRKWGVLLWVLALAVTAWPSAAQDDEPPSVWQPTPGTSWQIQLSHNERIDTSFDVAMYDIDLFDAPQEVIDALHADGRVVICYFSAGSFEDWRPDVDAFPAEVIGAEYEGWEGEWWLDIRRLDLLGPIMEARLDLAVEKGCDGVDPDNVEGYENESGFPLTYEDQLAFNLWLAEQAHARGLSVALKNDLGQIEDLVDVFDFQVNEECFQYRDCDTLTPFIEADKAVFNIEYRGMARRICPQANARGFSTLFKTLDLDAEVIAACWDWGVDARRPE